MSSDKVPEEVSPQSSHDTGLHSFTKLAIAYLGILLGLAVIFLLLPLANYGHNVNYAAQNWFVAYHVLLIPLMIIAIDQLRRGRKLGAYLAYASLAFHHSIYIPNPSFLTFLLVMSVIVGVLLLGSFRFLR